MAMPKLINELPAASLGAGDLFAAKVGGVTSQVTATQIITEAASFTQSGTGATSRTVQGRLRDTVSVKDFSATGDGVTNDKAAITAAFAASNHVFFPQGTYYMGTFGSGGPIIAIAGAGGPVTIATNGIVKFKCESTANVIPVFFEIENSVDVSIGDMYFEDTGYDFTVSWRGAVGIDLHITDGEPIRNVVINSIHGKNLVAPLRCYGTSATRCTGVKVGLIWAEDCYYGVNLANNGDSVKIGLIYTSEAIRSSYVYGIENYEANIFSDSPRAASANCLIAAGISGGGDTTGLKIRYAVRNTTNVASLISCTAFDENSRRIENVELDLDVDSDTVAKVLTFKAYNADGSVENTGATNNVFDKFRIRGRVSATGDHAYIYCQPSTKGSIQFDDGFTAAKINATIPLYFNQTKGVFETGTFAPTIVGTGTAGAGTYTTQSGRYQVVGTRCFFEIALVWTAHTGAGNTTIDNLPFTSSSSSLITALNVVYDELAVGAGTEIGAAVQINTDVINVYTMDPTGGAVSLLALDTAGSLYISGHYEITPSA